MENSKMSPDFRMDHDNMTANDIVYSVMVIAFMFAAGCNGRDSEKSGTRDEYKQYEKDLIGAGTDEEKKWQVTVKYFKPIAEERSGIVEDAIKEQLVFPGSELSELWLDYYLNIVTHLELHLHEVTVLCTYLDSDHRSVVDYSVADEGAGGGSRVYIRSKKTEGEWARLWLLRITGNEFRNKADCDKWLLANRDRLSWNRERGLFVIPRQ